MKTKQTLTTILALGTLALTGCGKEKTYPTTVYTGKPLAVSARTYRNSRSYNMDVIIADSYGKKRLLQFEDGDSAQFALIDAEIRDGDDDKITLTEIVVDGRLIKSIGEPSKILKYVESDGIKIDNNGKQVEVK